MHNRRHRVALSPQPTPSSTQSRSADCQCISPRRQSRPHPEDETTLAERFARVPATLEHGGARACYNPVRDIIFMPPRAFSSAALYYATSRTNAPTGPDTPHTARPQISTPRLPAYAREELSNSPLHRRVEPGRTDPDGLSSVPRTRGAPKARVNVYLLAAEPSDGDCPGDPGAHCVRRPHKYQRCAHALEQSVSADRENRSCAEGSLHRTPGNGAKGASAKHGPRAAERVPSLLVAVLRWTSTR